jgi:CxxC-x17-CxxC domain-containing protein
MGNFNRGGGFGDKKSGGFGRRDGGGRDFGRGGRDGGGFGGRDGGRPAMHQATCAECGASCEVPFKPTGDRPVYCSNCFKGKEASGPSRFGDRGNDRGERREFSKPSFSESRPAGNASVVTKEQIESLHAKMDKILRTLEQLSSLGKDFGKEVVKDAKEDVKKIEKKVAAKVTAKVTEVRAAVSKAIAPKAAGVKKVIKKAKKK